MAFTYRTGQRPLEGYTIKRGLGSGGFGEVYLAISESGKEVALKLIRSYSETELRGISHCLNLKHPNLVHLYDLRRDSQSRHWLIMEYVFGESLSQALNRHPRGLPVSLAKEWFSELAKAVDYLHDHGVVHRDLKPANIFIENGVLKLGDYGLCKAMSTSRCEEATRNVGTVAYMAPEVSNGKAGSSSDVYSAGIILYEMLTGCVPFTGSAPGEVLLKHQTDLPDFGKVPVGFVPILEKALHKDPNKRYRSLAEMARAVDAVGSGYEPAASPDSDTAVSMRVEPFPHLDKTSMMDRTKTSPPVVPEHRATISLRQGRSPNPEPTVAPTRPSLMSELTGSLFFSALLAVPVALGGALLIEGEFWHTVGRLYFLIVGLSWAVLIPARIWTRQSTEGKTWHRRALLAFLAGSVGLGAVWLEGWTPELMASHETILNPSESHLSGLIKLPQEGWNTGLSYLVYFAVIFGLIRWWRIASPSRSERFSLFPVLVAAFVGFLAWPLWAASSELPVTPLIAILSTAVVIQLASPWAPPPPPAPRRYKLRTA